MTCKQHFFCRWPSLLLANFPVCLLLSLPDSAQKKNLLSFFSPSSFSLLSAALLTSPFFSFLHWSSSFSFCLSGKHEEATPTPILISFFREWNFIIPPPPPPTPPHFPRRVACFFLTLNVCRIHGNSFPLPAPPPPPPLENPDINVVQNTWRGIAARKKLGRK